MFRTFVAFCIFARIALPLVHSDQVLAFLEFLAFNKVSHHSINNYLSAVKSQLSLYNLDISMFSNPRIRLFTKSLALSAPLKITLNSIIDIPTLTSIVLRCDSMFMGQVYKAAFLLSFFSFLRISNLVPHAISKFNPLEQLARADIIFAPPGALVLVKWSKTLQLKNKLKILKIPSISNSPLCPVSALQVLLAITPKGDNRPLFQIKSNHQWFPLTYTKLRRALSIILKHLNLQNSKFTFHSFRRSGATLAFNSNVPIQDIQSHGTWSSDCVWSYITQDHQASTAVASTFQSLLAS